MPAQFKEGTVNSYDSNTQMGSYKENGTAIDKDFETLRPEVDVQPGQSITVLVVTPSGKNVSIGIKIGGIDR